MRIRATALAAGLFLALCANAARSDSEKCSEAREQYETAKGNVSSALRGYALCIAESKARDDCAIEFSRLHDAQTDFESAVSDYEDCQ